MFKQFLSIALIALLFIGCVNNNKEEQTTAAVEGSNEAVAVTVADFNNTADEHVGKMVMLTGTVDHVCKHGGKRMFIVDQDTDERIKIVTGENMASFNTDLEGNDVKITGTVDELRIDENYLAEWEAELIMDAEDTKMKETSDGTGHEGHEHEGHHHEDSEKGEEADQGLHIPGMDQIAKYRQELKDKGVEHLSFYSIVATDYEVVDEAETENM